MSILKHWMLTIILLAASFSTNAQKMELTNRQQALVAIAANEARGNMEGLKQALNNGFDNGLTVSEAKEALSQLYAYTGFPRSLNALGALQQVIKEREAEGKKTEPGRRISLETSSPVITSPLLTARLSPCRPSLLCRVVSRS